MFSTSVRAALVSLVVCVLSVSASPELSVKVTGPDTADGIEKLNVVVDVKNTGDSPLKLLNDPNGPLSKMPTNTFSITDESGSNPAFVGVKVKYVPEFVAKQDDSSFFTVLAPGQSVQVTHQLSKAYNFTNTGEGSYNFEANNLFYSVDPASKAVVPIHANAESHSASLSGTLGIPRPGGALSKRASFVGCSASQQSDLNTAATNGNSYASSAKSYLVSHTSSTSRYATWFGAYTSARHSTVQSHFTNIASHAFSSYTFDCTCTEADTYAYVYPDDFGKVYLCGAFWQAPATGTDSKAGTLVHESSHFTTNGGTQDYAYGQSGCKSLATSNPGHAIMNADCHEYFAENSPPLS